MKPQRPSKPWYRHLSKFLKQVVCFPHYCLLCHNLNEERICQGCQQYLLSVAKPCQGCGIPLLSKNVFCGACIQKRPEFDTIFSAFLYQSPIDTLIHNFKHNGNQAIGRAMGELFTQAIRNHYQSHHLSRPQAVVAVPMHWRKQWQRGFNQADILCDHISKAFSMTHLDIVKRLHSGPEQKNLTRKQRLHNLKNCFTVKQTLNGEHIAIVDDVMTTGATVNTLAKALKDAGAGEITVWVLARTPIK